MPFPLIEVLTAGAEKAFPLLSELAKTALSYNEILRQVTAAGFELKRQIGLDIIGALRDNVNPARMFRLIKSTTMPLPEYFNLAKGTTHKNYSYRVEVTKPGEEKPDYVTVISDNLLNENQVLGTADAMLSNTEATGLATGGANYSIQVVDAIKAKDLILE